MNARTAVIGGVAAAAAVSVLLCCVGIILPLLGGTAAQAQCSGVNAVPAAPSTPTPESNAWTAIRRQHATTIVAVGRQKGVPPRGWVIAVATSMQESKLLNLANDAVPNSLRHPNDGVGHDHDSVGLFQQRVGPPEGQGTWGSAADLMQPSVAATKFFNALSAVRDWWTIPLNDAAQAVQHSATSGAYQQWEEQAERLVASIAGVSRIQEIGGGHPLAPCGATGAGTVMVGPKGWVQPVDAKVVSPYGQREGRLHAGADLGAARNTPIRAASTGIVTKVRCDASTGTCDRDGGLDVKGCGWYVEVTTSTSLTISGALVTNVVTRYCHMVRQPEVAVGQRVNAGQVLGFVGSSGHSSGPHLHFEVHLNVVQPAGSVDGTNSYDPERFMAAVAAPLER